MTQPNALSHLLLPELEGELAKTRKVLAALPDDSSDFKSHEKSRSVASLAGHTADLVSFLHTVLTRPEVDFGTNHRTPLPCNPANKFSPTSTDSPPRR